MILNSAKLGRLDVDDASFASGGAGTVHWGRLAGSLGRSYCVKLLTSPKPGDFDKITWMCANPPTAVNAGWGMLCWPIDMLSKPGGTAPVGYVMPVATPGSVELSNLTQLRWPGKNPPPLDSKLHRTTADGMARRMLVACNLAAGVSQIHRLGFVFVDLKPQNILISGAGSISVVDLDSLQLQVAGRLYRGPLGSGEYMPFESYRMNPANSGPIDKSWDLFALAVIIYELLFGIHPYTATVSDSFVGIQTIEDSIRYKMYVHGANRANLASIPPPHQEVSKVPAELAQLFRRAFDAATPAERPSAQEWGEALFKAARAGLPALSGSLYNVARPPSRGTPVRAPAPQPSTNGAFLLPCWGPINSSLSCPYRNLNPRLGAPNQNSSGGNRVYVCPDCLAQSMSTASTSSSAQLQPCWGPLNSSLACPHRNTPLARFGVPNRANGVGNMVFVCPDCLGASITTNQSSGASSSSSTLDQACWGSWGRSCPNQSLRSQRPWCGTPNKTLPDGSSIYLCPTCINGMAPTGVRSPGQGTSSSPEKENEFLSCLGVILFWGAIYGIIYFIKHR